jgi:hypothetical protein
MKQSPPSRRARHPRGTAPRLVLLVLLGLFSLGQFFAPLLHAHVSPPAAQESGIHLPVSVPSGGASTRTAAAPHLDDADHGAVITIPAEHRRDDAGPCPSADGPCTDGQRSHTEPRHARFDGAPAEAQWHPDPPALRPPARAPPHPPR